MSRGIRIGIIVIVVIAGFLIAALVVAPRIFQVDTYRSDVVSYLEEKTGRHVEIGHLSLVLFPTVTIRADNVAIANPADFPTGNWLTVKRINAQLDLSALWDRQIVVHTLKLDQPTLNLISNGQGQWNFQISDPPANLRERAQIGSVAAKSPSPKGLKMEGGGEDTATTRTAFIQDPASQTTQSSEPPLFTLEKITRVVLTNGTLSTNSTVPDRRVTPVDCKGISGELNNINLAVLSDPSLKSPQPSDTLLHGLPAIPNATGELSVATLSVGALQATEVSSKIEASPAAIQLNDLHFGFYDGKGTGSIRLDLTGADPQFQAQARLSGVNVQKLLEAFPAWRGEMTGHLETNVNISGDARSSSDPWAGKQGEGTVTILKGRLPKLQLNKSLLDLARLAELGPPQGDLSAFSSITVDWQLAGGIVSSRSIRIIGTGITVDGSGNSELAGAGGLHYQGVAEVEARKNALSDILASMAGSELKDGKIAVPFVLEGTFSKPVFRLNPNPHPSVPAAVTHPEQDKQMLRGLFNLFQRKKSQSK